MKITDMEVLITKIKNLISYNEVRYNSCTDIEKLLVLREINTLKLILLIIERG